MIKAFWKAAVWALIILLLSIMPPNDLTPDGIFTLIPHLDKIAHALFYMVFSFLLYSGFLGYGKIKWSKLLTLLIAIIFGIVMELIQGYYFPARNMDLLDILANTAGAIVGLAVYPSFSGLLRKIHIHL